MKLTCRHLLAGAVSRVVKVGVGAISGSTDRASERRTEGCVSGQGVPVEGRLEIILGVQQELHLMKEDFMLLVDELLVMHGALLLQ